MGVDVDAEVHGAHVDSDVEGRLFALMPDPRKSTRTFVELLFEDEPEALARMLENRVYASLADALAGIHDLVSLMLVARAVEDAEYDYLVVDTAPSRYAVDFIRYPGRLAALLEGRAMSFFANLAQRASIPPPASVPKDERGLVAWGKKRVESAIGRVLDRRTLKDLTGLFTELSIVRGRFASLARASEQLLLGPQARYVLVAAPTGSARADLIYVSDKLTTLKKSPFAFVLNRADEGAPSWMNTLARADSVTLPVKTTLDRLETECAARKRAGDELADELKRRFRSTMQVRLPTVEARDPSQVVRALADELSVHIATLSA